ncbi:rRNA pseudouridine synthase [Fusobacteria bacterium ZRK30]|nr:rRNA pseudouridine synthase [Fusobacteria bacterium ZRK30]
MEKVRLNKYLASIGIGSRREIDKMVEEKKIMVNGEYPSPGMKVNIKDKISVDGKLIGKTKEKKVYYLLNKPKKVISAVKDDRGRRTVIDFVKTKERVYPIGRLDYDTEGMIILTNDGDLYNKVIHPKGEVYKKYLIQAAGHIKKINLGQLKAGIKLEDGLTLPAKVRFLREEGSTTWLTVAIREGRNRQVRRMLDAIGHRVISLTRVKIGTLTMGDLEVGKYRPLTKEEIKYLKDV